MKDVTRQEIFITLRYLLENCYDEKHTSKTIELTRFALERYNVNLDRRRANEILDFLVSCDEEFNGVLPYQIVKVENKPRYYIKRTLFNEEETKKIAEVLYKDSSMSKLYARKRADIFLTKTCNQEEKDKILNDLDKKEKHLKRSSTRDAKRLMTYEGLRDDHMCFHFKPRHVVMRANCSSIEVLSMMLKLNRGEDKDNKYCVGVIYDVINQGKDTDVVIYIPEVAGAVIINQEDLIIDKNSIKRWMGYSFDLKSNLYTTIDEMVESFYNGKSGNQLDITFKVLVGSDGIINNVLLEKYKHDYDDFFHKEMIYEIQDEEVELHRPPYGELQKFIKNYLVATVSCNFESFKKWFWDYHLYDSLVVIDPKHVNNRLLRNITRRFMIVLDKYGERPIQVQHESPKISNASSDIKDSQEQ